MAGHNPEKDEKIQNTAPEPTVMPALITYQDIEQEFDRAAEPEKQGE